MRKHQMGKRIPMESMRFKLLLDHEEIQDGWRLSYVDEVKKNLGEVKGILEMGTIARLLDGWVTGSGYEYKPKRGCRGGMTNMLVFRTEESRHSDGSFNPAMYEGIELSGKAREDALLLSSGDKTKEVVQFVLYLFAKDAERRDKLMLKIKVVIFCFIILCLSVGLPLRHLAPWNPTNCYKN